MILAIFGMKLGLTIKNLILFQLVLLAVPIICSSGDEVSEGSDSDADQPRTSLKWPKGHFTEYGDYVSEE